MIEVYNILHLLLKLSLHYIVCLFLSEKINLCHQDLILPESNGCRTTNNRTPPNIVGCSVHQVILRTTLFSEIFYLNAN